MAQRQSKQDIINESSQFGKFDQVREELNAHYSHAQLTTRSAQFAYIFITKTRNIKVCYELATMHGDIVQIRLKAYGHGHYQCTDFMNKLHSELMVSLSKTKAITTAFSTGKTYKNKQYTAISVVSSIDELPNMLRDVINHTSSKMQDFLTSLGIKDIIDVNCQ